MEQPVVVKKAVNRPKVIGALILLIGVPVTCVRAGIAKEAGYNQSLWAGLLLVCFFVGLGFFVVGRLRD